MWKRVLNKRSSIAIPLLAKFLPLTTALSIHRFTTSTQICAKPRELVGLLERRGDKWTDGDELTAVCQGIEVLLDIRY
jgi:hypothetical protein